MKRFKNILFFVDGGDDPAQSLLRALSLAEANEARFTLVDVIEPVDTPRELKYRYKMDLTDMLIKERKLALENLIEQKLLQGFAMHIDDERVHMIKGDITESINEVAESTQADIIVMGTVGRVGIPGLFIGNTAEEVLQTTHCSILAVKPDGFVSPVA